MKRTAVLILLAALLCVLAAGCGAEDVPQEQPTPDPHEGQVYIYDGYGWTWMTPLEGVETNVFTADDFEDSNGEPVYVGTEYTVKKGIDVSEHQHAIDWNAVAKENLDFAYIRAGRRGYTQGGLFTDEYFDVNMKGASGIGLETGVYFFSQAITEQEAVEEAEYILDLIKPYNITLPIVYDWEKIDEPDARTKDLDVDTLTTCAVAFCETIKSAGYEPCVYYNRTIGYYRYDLTQLTDYKVWFALPYEPPDITYPSFYYRFDMWQYTIEGTCSGIDTETDFDFIFTPVSVNEASAATDGGSSGQVVYEETVIIK